MLTFPRLLFACLLIQTSALVGRWRSCERTASVRVEDLVQLSLIRKLFRSVGWKNSRFA